MNVTEIKFRRHGDKVGVYVFVQDGRNAGWHYREFPYTAGTDRRFLDEVAVSIIAQMKDMTLSDWPPPDSV